MKSILKKVALLGSSLVLLLSIFLPTRTISVSASENTIRASDVSVKLDPTYQVGPFEGWGTALAWFANITGGWPDSIKNELADALFGENGLNFNIARYNIGGGDSPETEPYMRLGGAVPGYWNRPAEFGPPEGNGDDWKEIANWWNADDPTHWNWEADKNQQWWLTAAKERGANLFEAFSNSAPYFMTQSGYVSGNFNSSKDNLKPDQYTNFAIYLTKVIQYLQNNLGVNFRTLSPVNEPNTNYWGAKGRQEGSHWDPASQAKIINEVQNQIDTLNLNTVVSAMDETNPSTFGTNWGNYTNETKANIGQMNVHTYGTGQRPLVRDLAKIEGKRLWMSEVDVGGSVPQNFDAIDPGLDLAERITSDIKNLEPSAWVLWQAIEDEVNMNADHENSNWGLIQVDFDPNDFNTLKWHKNKKYYVMGNYSKFIRPGYKIINANNENTLAAVDEGGSKVVVIYTNRSQKEQVVDFDLSGFSKIGENATATPFVTSATQNIEQMGSIDIEGKTLNATVGPKSVTTFVIESVSGVNSDASFIKADSEYKILNKNSSKAVDIAQDGKSVVQMDYNRNGQTQDWKIEKVSEGNSNREVYKIIHADSGKILTLENTVATLAEDVNSDNQKWLLSTNGNGEFTFISQASKGVLEVYSQSKDNGATIGTWTPNAGSNQTWRLVESGITNVDHIAVWTLPGTAPILPDVVKVYYGDGTSESKTVTWDEVTSEKYATENTFTVEGEIEGSSQKAVATIQVSAIKNIEPLKVKTAIGVEPVLPSGVSANLTNGSTAVVPVKWETMKPSDYEKLGKFKVEGTVEGSNNKVIAYVQVRERALENIALNNGTAEFPKVSASFTGKWDSVNHVNDGDYSSKRWTNWDPDEWRSSDWVAFDFGKEENISEVKFTFYDDQGGTRPPKSLFLEYWSGNEWKEIPNTQTNINEEDVVQIQFDNIITSQIRVMMEAMENTCIAISEIEIMGLGNTPATSSDATLHNIIIDGQPLEKFEPGTFSYEVQFDSKQSTVPEIEVITNDLFATYSIELPDSLPGQVIINVKSEDDSQSLEYVIDFVSAPSETPDNGNENPDHESETPGTGDETSGPGNQTPDNGTGNGSTRVTKDKTPITGSKVQTDNKNSITNSSVTKSELPNTASNVYNSLLIGSVLLIFGGVWFIFNQRRKAKNYKL